MYSSLGNQSAKLHSLHSSKAHTILVYPRVDSEAPLFILQICASDIGIGVVSEQDGHVVAYASCTLTESDNTPKENA